MIYGDCRASLGSCHARVDELTVSMMDTVTRDVA